MNNRKSNDIQDLVMELSEGHTGNFQQLYEILVDKIFGYVSGRVATKEIALDLTQDSFVDLYQALGSFEYRTEGEFYAFVFTLVKRKLARHYADKHTKAYKYSVDIELVVDATQSDDRENADAVQRALKELDKTSRDVVTLYHWSGFSLADIALLLEMSEEAVRVRHHRAKRKIALILERHSL